MSAPRIEFAPGLFSTTIVHPFCSAIFCKTMRVALSVMPPGGYGMIQRIDLVGHTGVWAWRAVEASSASAANASLCSCMVKPPVARFGSRQPSDKLDELLAEVLSFEQRDKTLRCILDALDDRFAVFELALSEITAEVL